MPFEVLRTATSRDDGSSSSSSSESDDDDDGDGDAHRPARPRRAHVEWAGVAELETEKMEAVGAAIEVASALMGVDSIIVDSR